MPRKPVDPLPDDDLTTTLERVALADVRPHPRNYHLHPEPEIQHLMASLRTHGVYRNVVIARDGTLLAGHGVVEAARRLGLTHLPMKRKDYGADEPRALQLLAGDNEIAREAQKNEEALVALLQELSQDDPLALLGTGFDEATLKALAEQAGLVSPDFQPVGIEEQGRLDEKQPLECPACGHTWVP
jgi:ParB family chromosome partitioning protein